MRNLKRALSLAMASVMTLGMMTVGASAKGIADFSDAAEITNADAVAVTSAVGIFKGYDDGEFKGENVVTRAEMAVICAKLLYGADVDPAQFTGINKFTDVPAWAEGYVNLCASLGIIVGRDEKTFDPSATVSTVEASVMLAKTLGYFKNQKDFGDDWKLATTAKATQLGLYGELKLAADAGLTRDSVAELVFNTMTKAVPVQYNELLGVYYNANQGIIYALEFNYLQTLGYKNFNLVYKTEENTVYGRPATTWGVGSYKAYGSGSASGSQADDYLTADGDLINDHVRMLDKDEIVTVAMTPDYVYTTGTDQDKIYKALGANVCSYEIKTDSNGKKYVDSDYTWTYYVNGEEVKYDETTNANILPPQNIDKAYHFTEKGAVVEIYVDDYAGTVTLCEYNYYLGEVSSVKDEDAGVYANIRALSDGGKILDNKKFYTDELATDDLVVYTVDMDDDGKFYIAELMTPATVTGEVSRVENDKTSKDAYIRLVGDSAKYYYTSDNHNVFDVDTTTEEHPELNEDYVLYMTPDNYVLGFLPVSETLDQYLYVLDSDEELKDWLAKAVLTDATTVKAEVGEKYKDLAGEKQFIAWDDSDNNPLTTEKINTNIDELIWKYTVNDKGVYTLTEVDKDVYPANDDDRYEINNGKSYIAKINNNTDVLIDKQTIFVDVEGEKSYVGYHNVPNVDNAKIAYVMDKHNVAEVVFILDGEFYDENSTYFMLTSDDRETLKYKVDGVNYWEYFDAYVDGEKTTLTVAYDAYAGNNGKLEEGVLYKAIKTIDGEYITEVVNATGKYNGTLTAVGDNAFRIDDLYGDNIFKFDTNDDTKFVIVEAIYDDNGDFDEIEITDGDIKDMFVGMNDDGQVCSVSVVKEDEQTAQLVYVYLTKGAVPLKAQADINSYISGISVYGTEDGKVTAGQIIYLEVTGAVDAKAKANIGAAYEVGMTYTVDINGQKYEAVCVVPGTLFIKYVVQANDLNGNDMVIELGTVTETKAEQILDVAELIAAVPADVVEAVYGDEDALKNNASTMYPTTTATDANGNTITVIDTAAIVANPTTVTEPTTKVESVQTQLTKVDTENKTKEITPVIGIDLAVDNGYRFGYSVESDAATVKKMTLTGSDGKEVKSFKGLKNGHYVLTFTFEEKDVEGVTYDWPNADAVITMSSNTFDVHDDSHKNCECEISFDFSVDPAFNDDDFDKSFDITVWFDLAVEGNDPAPVKDTTTGVVPA